MREEEMRKPENIEHEVIDRLKNLDVEDFDYSAVDANYADAVLKARNIILDLYNKEKEKNKELCREYCPFRNQLIQILGLENKEDCSDEKIVSLLEIIVDENNRLEDIEDRKVQIEYELVFAKGVKSVEDKIKVKIEEYKKQVEKMEKDDIGVGFTLGKEWSDLKAKVEFGQSFLKEEE